MKRFHTYGIALFALAAFLLSGCTDSAPSGPTPSLGGATVTKYVSIGNSLTAGYQSNGLYASAQAYSYPNLIAAQLKIAGATIGTFEQPTWPDPGNPDPATGKAARFVIISLADPNNPIIGPAGENVTASQPSNATTLLRPYDNLGLPGALLAGFMDTTGLYQGGFAPAILRSSGGFPKSVYQQILLLKQMGTTPDLVTFWLGANDVLGFAASGGVLPAAGNKPTDAAIFGGLYLQALGALRQALPNAKIVVATIPDVKAVPYFTTVNPKIAPELAALNVDLYYQQHLESGVGSGKTRLTGAYAPLITLEGAIYAPLIGQATGKFYTDNHFPALPAGIDTTKPFGVHPQNPFPDALILDSTEQVMATNAVNDFNTAIKSAAATNNAQVFDAFTFFNNVKANGYSVAGETYTTDYVSGGLFSLDGVHPTSRGYAIVANQYIKVMNSSFGMNIPYVDVASIPGIPGPLGKYIAGKVVPSIPSSAFKSFERVFGVGQ